jgi:Ca2+-binding EF-hand superfamily protein
MSKAMTAACCALVLAALPLNAAQNNKSANRFAAMDRNGDGVITRSEWNGSDRSFQVHDWNGDGVLSGPEVTPGARRQQPARQDGPTFDSASRDYEFDDWTPQGFDGLDHNRDGRLTTDEWHFDREGFRRADHNGDGVVTRAEFLGDDSYGDEIDDRVAFMDANHDGRVTRQEWHGTREAFDRLDGNRDGILSGTEINGNDPPPDLFTSVDMNRDGQITRDEWHWSRSSFDERDRNRDGRLSRDEFASATHPQSRAYQAGFERGRVEGLQAGREDKERNQGWDLDGQRELETADSGYTQAVGARDEYQAGYRDGFRPAYREGFANAR